MGVFVEAPPGADKARQKRRSGQNSSNGSEKRILGTARGGEAEDAGCSSHLAPTTYMQKNRLIKRFFCFLYTVLNRQA
ncbi:MAG: hypothetical protein II995_05595 [Oscillospiraceae bacterium]|nr:hypothetical protein [Oscillospiraceae bacterium]